MPNDTPSTVNRAGEIIVRTHDEGGSIALRGVRGPAGWTAFALVCEEHPPAEILAELSGAEPVTVVSFAGPAETWEGALSLLDRFLWHVLTPEFVHPDFSQAVLAVVRERAAGEDDPCAEFVDDWLPRWESTCRASEGS